MFRHLRFAPIGFVLLTVGCFHSNPNNSLKNMPKGTGFIVHTARSGDALHKYSVFVPRDYDPARKYPTIVFLHGMGETGSDGIGCTTVGIGPAIARRNGDFPFIVVFPQSDWKWTSDEAGLLVLDVLDDAERQYSIDSDRVALSGVSFGGEGTWVLGARYPQRWSALVPMAGTSSVKDAPKLTKTPIWVLHNSGDPIVSASNSREMFKRIKAAGGNIQYTEYDAFLSHNCWDAAYDKGELFEWLQKQRRNGKTAMR